MPDASDILRLKACPQCGYDLESLPREHACPECGFDHGFDDGTIVLRVAFDGTTTWSREMKLGVIMLGAGLAMFLLIPSRSLGGIGLAVALAALLGVLHEAWRIHRRQSGRPAMHYVFGPQGYAESRCIDPISFHSWRSSQTVTIQRRRGKVPRLVIDEPAAGDRGDRKLVCDIETHPQLDEVILQHLRGLIARYGQ